MHLRDSQAQPPDRAAAALPSGAPCLPDDAIGADGNSQRCFSQPWSKDDEAALAADVDAHGLEPILERMEEGARCGPAQAMHQSHGRAVPHFCKTRRAGIVMTSWRLSWTTCQRLQRALQMLRGAHGASDPPPASCMAVLRLRLMALQQHASMPRLSRANHAVRHRTGCSCRRRRRARLLPALQSRSCRRQLQRMRPQTARWCRQRWRSLHPARWHARRP